MQQEDSTNALWFLSGAAMGAVIALLFAPETANERAGRWDARHGAAPGNCRFRPRIL